MPAPRTEKEVRGFLGRLNYIARFISHLTATCEPIFKLLKKYKIRLNPSKCTFGVRSGKLLGFIVSGKGIKVDPENVKEIQEIPTPRTEKEVREFLV